MQDIAPILEINGGGAEENCRGVGHISTETLAR
jgi:hypothetical protein